MFLRSAECPAGTSADRTWTHTRIRRSVGAHAVEFSKTAAPGREGGSFSESALGHSVRGGSKRIAPAWSGLQGPALGSAVLCDDGDDTNDAEASRGEGRPSGSARPADRR